MKSSASKEFIQTMASFYESETCGNMYSLLKQFGQGFTGCALPEGFIRGTAKQCYRNSYNLAISLGLTYVEGIAIHEAHGVPLQHAWCVDDQGRVYDVTWDTPEKAQYFGIPFSTNYVLEVSLETGVYGILGYENRKIYELSDKDFMDPHWM